MPPYVLIEGKLKLQVLFQNEDGAVWKTYKKPFTVRGSINAVDDIPDKEDFIADAQKVLDEILNVGASVLRVTATKDYTGKFTASHNAEQIAEHVNGGGTAVLFYGAYLLQLSMIHRVAGADGVSSVSSVDFTTIYNKNVSAGFDDHPEIYTISVSKSGNCHLVTKQCAHKSEVESLAADLEELKAQGVGSNTLTVVGYSNPAHFSHTVEQIYEHVRNFGAVELIQDRYALYQLARVMMAYNDDGTLSPSYAVFYCVDEISSKARLNRLLLKKDGTCETEYIPIASASDVDTAIRSIQTEMQGLALDVTELEDDVKELKEKGGNVTVDYELNPESLNPVANAVVTAYFIGFAEAVADAFDNVLEDTADLGERANDAEVRLDKIDEQMGDIDAALDAIIAIQEELIGVTLITFTIDGIEYQAEEGMSLVDWAESAYSNNAYAAITDSGLEYTYIYRRDNGRVVSDGPHNTPIDASKPITQGAVYYNSDD